ncbi:cell division protein FtsL [Candidatus Methylomirabilis sp.]|uniref:cell division protein FtsL n=1 Tax=Candidatus Methylomirabilis sp. TaxID=2032687 RepID=UPI002A5E3DDD|nr:cell division protein FtsL [Candidatus Methylomirabilis sp.]
MRGQSIAALTTVGRDRASSLLKPRVDQIRRFDLLPSLLLGSLVLLGVLCYVWQHIQVVRLGYQVEYLAGERAGLVRQQKELRLEVARLRSLRRVEEIAHRELGLTSPKPGQVIVVESLLPKTTGNDL